MRSLNIDRRRRLCDFSLIKFAIQMIGSKASRCYWMSKLLKPTKDTFPLSECAELCNLFGGRIIGAMQNKYFCAGKWSGRVLAGDFPMILFS